MFNSKALDIVNTLSVEEMKEFGQFIRSPYFNSNKNLIKLFDVVKGSRGKDVTEEFLYGKIFPGKKYNYGIFKNLLSELYVQMCDYLAIKRVRDKTADKNSYLIKELVDRKLVKQADKWIKTTHDQLSNRVLAIEDLHTDFLMEEYSTFSNYFRDHRWLVNLSKKEDPLLMSKKFAVYFLARFISHYLFITHSLYKLKKERDMTPMLNVIEDTYTFLKDNFNEEMPTVEVLYHVVKMNNEPDNTDWYYKLKDKVLKYRNNVPSQVGRNGFIYLSNYCGDKIEEGNDDFISELFFIDREYLKDDLPIRMTNSMSPETFEKFVINGLAAGEIDMVGKFINDYTDKLPENAREECYEYANAYYCLYNNDFEKALEHLSKVNTDYLLVELGIKELHLMIYYELGEWERFYPLAASMKGFVSNHTKLHPERKISRLAFIKNISALGKIKENSGLKKRGLDAKLNELLKNFKKEPSISRVWLSRKAEELKTKVA